MALIAFFLPIGYFPRVAALLGTKGCRGSLILRGCRPGG